VGKLTKPTKPKGMNKGTSVRRGRVPGFAPSYTPEQTARYQSQALRYSKAVELSAGGPDHIEWNGQILSGDDAANLRDAGGRAFKLTDRVGFYYQSARSKVDIWTVRYGGGGLEGLTAFSDAITKSGTAFCTEPVVTWRWESPAFDWSAQTIKVCAPNSGGGGGGGGAGGGGGGGAGGGGGGGAGGGGGNYSSSWFPAPPNTLITGRVYVVGPESSLDRAFALNSAQAIVQQTGVLIQALDLNGNFYDSYSTGIFVPNIGFGYLLSSHVLIIYSSLYPDGEVTSTQASITIVFDTPPLPPPPPGPAGSFPPTPGSPNGPNGYSPGAPPNPANPGKATAGGTFTSNTFTASSTSVVQVQLDYTTVPDIGAITGSIAVQLWSAAGVMLAELRETPSNGGAGTLEATFALEADQAYYVVIVIPETCYCDAAKVAIGGSGFKCDCPDYTKAQKPSLNSVYNSEQVDRDWTSSEAGCDQEQGCKHINGTKLFLGLPVEPPTDYPV